MQMATAPTTTSPPTTPPAMGPTLEDDCCGVGVGVGGVGVGVGMLLMILRLVVWMVEAPLKMDEALAVSYSADQVRPSFSPAKVVSMMPKSLEKVEAHWKATADMLGTKYE